MSTNIWIGSGNLGATPELRTTPSGKSVLNFTMAVDRTYTTGNGTRVTEVDWIPVVVWGRQAEHQAKYLQKGSSITVRGSLRPRKYTDSDGVEHRTFEVVAEQIDWHTRIRKPSENNDVEVSEQAEDPSF